VIIFFIGFGFSDIDDYDGIRLETGGRFCGDLEGLPSVVFRSGILLPISCDVPIGFWYDLSGTGRMVPEMAFFPSGSFWIRRPERPSWVTSLDSIDTLTVSGGQQYSTFYFTNNQIGSIPASLGKPNLMILIVNNNNLTTLPEYIFTESELARFDVRNNMFSVRKKEWIAGRVRSLNNNWLV
jgi:hypothetical protein